MQNPPAVNAEGQHGAANRARTDTEFLPKDFKSFVSANSTIAARRMPDSKIIQRGAVLVKPGFAAHMPERVSQISSGFYKRPFKESGCRDSIPAKTVFPLWHIHTSAPRRFSRNAPHIPHEGQKWVQAILLAFKSPCIHNSETVLKNGANKAALQYNRSQERSD